MHTTSNNNTYDDKEDYKAKPCFGLNCNNRKTYLYNLSLTIGSSFLCTDCKRSVERAGWTLQRIEYEDLKAKKQNSNRQLEIKNGVTNIKGMNKDYIRSRKPLPELQ